MANKRHKNLFSLSRIFFYLLCLALFYLTFRYLANLEEIGRLFLSMDPVWILAALSVQSATYLLYAMVLKVLLLPSPSRPDYLMLCKLALVSIFLNQSIPSGGLSGSGYIFKRLKKENVAPPAAVSVLIIECLCYYAAFILLFSVAFLSSIFFSDARPGRIEIYTFILGIIFYLILTALLIILGMPKTIGKLQRMLKPFPFLLRNFDRFILQLGPPESRSGVLAMAMKNYKISLLAVLLQGMIIGCDVLCVFTLLEGFGTEIPLHSLAFAVMLSMVVGALPITPGGLLTFESAMTFFLVSTGLPVHLSLTVTMLFRFLSFWLPMPVGVFVYRNLQRKHPKSSKLS